MHTGIARMTVASIRELAFAAGALLALTAHAHHSSSMYDRTKPVTIEADVVEFRWVNPHAYLTVVDAKPQAGTAPKTWSIEMSSPGVLTRNGWTKRTFNAGDKITLKFAPLRNGDAGGIFMQATLADGKVITYSVDAQTE
ncbi:MAG TPA: DUF6152 family protein [Gammaproteobacteria bacterium]|jgi:hypothetical protein|nr:DUF6152 family protein [Gammaproteobacteria bacterium]